MTVNIKEILKEFENLPRFEDGRIDYTKSRRAVALMCFVRYKSKILLLKRSNKVLAYQGKWNVLGGFMDEDTTIEKKVLEELVEETGITKKIVKSIEVKELRTLIDSKIGRTWLIFPILVELKGEDRPNVKLDWEHTDYRWIEPSEIAKFDIVVNLDRILISVLEN